MTINDGLMCKPGLTPEEFEMIVSLTKICEEHDNIDLSFSLDYPMLKERRKDQTNDFLYYHNGILVGYLGMFAIVREDEVEISGMVHPGYRNQGIFKTMVNAMNKECERRGVRHKLMVVNNASVSGKAAVQRLGGLYKFAEYTMVYDSNKAIQMDPDDRLSLKRATEDQIPTLVQIGMKGFDDNETVMASLMKRNFSHARYQTSIASFEGMDIGMITVSEEEGMSYISGFCVASELQGKGLGTQILLRTVQSLLESGKNLISLDVETDNLNALGLYERCGFKVKSGYEYYVHK